MLFMVLELESISQLKMACKLLKRAGRRIFKKIGNDGEGC